MRTLSILVVVVFVSGSLASCVTQNAADVTVEASLDQFTPFCKTNADCSGGLVCAYETLVGCGAKGECRDLGPDGGEGACVGATTACGCDGDVVKIPDCWTGFAPAPVLPSLAKTCGDAKAG